MTQRMYGLWRSPISAEDAARGTARITEIAWAGETLVWCINGAILAQTGIDAPHILTPPNQKARGRLGYGGGELTADSRGVVFAGNDARLFEVALNNADLPRAITPHISGGAAAAPLLTPDGSSVIYGYSIDGEDGLAIINRAGGDFPRKIARGHDFYAQAHLHPRGEWLAYVAWDRPAMPWDSTLIRLARFDGAALHDDQIIAGGQGVSVMQPTFSPDGRTLAYISDEAGWWQLYLYDLETGARRRLTEAQAEYGTPLWVQGIRTFAFMPNEEAIYALRVDHGLNSLARVEIASGAETRLHDVNGYPGLRQIAISPSGEIAVIAGSTTQPDHVVSLRLSNNAARVRARSGYESLTPRLSHLQPISWKTDDDETAHGFYYPPVSFYGESGWGAPPLIVSVHGGPTSQARLIYEPDIHFFTTRGFAVLQVNHRGGTGYGKAYKNRYHGNWGVHDVQDSVSGALHLVQQGLADRERLIISGGSAGGFTVLQTLIDQPSVFKAGVCLFGVGNQFSLSFDTDWKFEADYNFTLLGALPDALDIWRARSPAFHADKIRDALIIFQGADDEVVPQAQADEIVAALKRRGVAHEYHVYAGEGHGFRKPETITHYLETTLRFLKTHVLYR